MFFQPKRMLYTALYHHIIHLALSTFLEDAGTNTKTYDGPKFFRVSIFLEKNVTFSGVNHGSLYISDWSLRCQGFIISLFGRNIFAFVSKIIEEA